jgi:hypothetical protein
MKTWVKYLVIGWSLICVGIIIVSFQIMKNDYIQYDYTFWPSEPQNLGKGETSGKGAGWEEVIPFLFTHEGNLLTKDQFIERIKGAKSIQAISFHKVKDRSIYVYLPIYALIVWALPILMFALLGILFGKNTPPS